MNHRSTKTCGFCSYYDSPDVQKENKFSSRLGFSANKKILADFFSCISSRFSTVIQMEKYFQRNHNCFNEPSAVSL